GEPTAHRRMVGLERPEVPPQRMVDDFLLSQPHHLAGWDRHAVQAKALGIHPELSVAPVLLTQAEVLPRLGRIFVDPELQRGLLGAGQRTSDEAGAPEQRIDTTNELVVTFRGTEEKRDLDAGFPHVHPRRVEQRAMGTSRPESTAGSIVPAWPSSRRS